MNFSFYLFGTPDGYDQFPSDANSLLFKKFIEYSNSESQLIVYRNDKLIYYSFIRKLNGMEHSFGVCLIFNSVYCSNIEKLFDDFFIHTIYAEILNEGEILQPDKSGNISFATQKFNHKQVERDRLYSISQEKIDTQFKQDFLSLDNSFITNNYAFKFVSIRDGNTAIMDAIRNYNQVLISKEDMPGPKRKWNLKWKSRYWIITLIILSILGLSAALLTINKNKTVNTNETKMVQHQKIHLNDSLTYQYSGEIRDGLPNGKGNAEYSDGRSYTGSFENGLRHGKGKMAFNGNIYEGEYVHDKAEGYGEMRYTDGSRYAGEWKNDGKNGYGTFYDSDGTEYTGQWINGNLQ